MHRLCSTRATRDARRCGANCRNGSTHLQASYGGRGLRQNTAAFNGGGGINSAVERRHIQRSGWLQAPEDVRILALEIAQKRDPDAKVGGGWIRNSLYKRRESLMSIKPFSIDVWSTECYLSVSPYDTLSATLRRLSVLFTQACELRPAPSSVRARRTWRLEGQFLQAF